MFTGERIALTSLLFARTGVAVKSPGVLGVLEKVVVTFRPEDALGVDAVREGVPPQVAFSTDLLGGVAGITSAAYKVFGLCKMICYWIWLEYAVDRSRG